jgi:hypothetical protein
LYLKYFFPQLYLKIVSDQGSGKLHLRDNWE